MALLLLTGCVGELPIVGLDRDGKVIDTAIRQGDYVEKMVTSVTDMQDSVIPILDDDDARSMMELREAALGLHLSGSVGLGDYFKLAGTIGFRLVFTNKQ